MMTSRERVLAALQCKQPDHVPFLEPVVDEEFGNRYLGKSLLQKSPGLGTGDEPVILQSLLGGVNYDALELADALDLDGIGISFWVKHMGIQAESEGHHMISGGLIKSKADLERVRLPDPDDPALYEPVREFIEKYRSSDKAIYAVLNLGSDPTILSMGFEYFSLATLTDRELVESLFEVYTSWYEKVVQHLCALDLDFLWTTDDIAFKTSTYVSPDMFRELFMPYYQRVASKISKPWIFHSDGDLNPILDDLIDLGMSGLHPIEPGPMNLSGLKKRYGNRLCFCGHIDVDVLSRGTPENVDQLVRHAIRDAGEGGGYICGSSNSITYYCQVENVKAMRDAILKYGKYE